MVSVSARPSAAKTDAIVVGVRPGVDPLESAPLEQLGFTAEIGSVVAVPTPDATAPVSIFVRLPEEPTLEDLRVHVAKALRRIGSAKTVTIDLGDVSVEHLAAAAEAAVLTAYRFDSYKGTGTKKKDDELQSIELVHADARKAPVKKAVAAAVSLAEAVCTARDWVNTPPGDLRPPAFAEAIKAAAPAGVKVEIWDEKKLAKENCGGILSVGRGSAEPPRLVKLTYTPSGAKKSTPHLALVGKGITFDSGGLSLKPGASMQTMKCDMGGAAAIVAAINAIAQIGLPVKVTAYACLAENLPSGTATRPGDVITMRNGKTVEILNTDAEGRMVLGDGLSLAAESDATHVIDAATLTGAAMVALGAKTAAVLGNDDAFEQHVLTAAETAGEAFWRLPITEEIADQLKATVVADLRQIGVKSYGGTLFAAAFLREFVGDKTWAHLDIAGPAFNDGSPYAYTPTGGTGYAVRTIVEAARALS